MKDTILSNTILVCALILIGSLFIVATHVFVWIFNTVNPQYITGIMLVAFLIMIWARYLISNEKKKDILEEFVKNNVN